MTDDRAGTKLADQYQPMRRTPPPARLFERANTPSVYSERSEPTATASERTDPPHEHCSGLRDSVFSGGGIEPRSGNLNRAGSNHVPPGLPCLLNSQIRARSA